jgi:glycosyltransferase involved in cell wall biosynthesis
VNLEDVTPLILTHNEEANLPRALERLKWAKQIVVVDSGSTDRTIELASASENVDVCTRPFENHTAQWNFGLEQIKTPWVLTLDADYICPESLPVELTKLAPGDSAYRAHFRYCIHGKPLRGSLYPPRVVLFRTERFRYRADGHTQTLDIEERAGELTSVLLHDDRKPLSRWLDAQSKYADLEVAKLLAAAPGALAWKDRLRCRILWMPLLTCGYCLVYKRLLLDGWPGIYYTFQRVYAELLLSLKLLAAKLRGEARGLEESELSEAE